VLEKAGFEPTLYRKFPCGRATEKGRALVYRNRGRGESGGVIYLAEARRGRAPCWHWYFGDAVPEEVLPVELNEDGLWDVRVVMEDGSLREFMQDESFTLRAGHRSDWIALNGTASPHTDPNHAMWKCFDGDSTTSWSSSLFGKDEVFIEVLTPFRLERGILTLRTLEKGRPRECRLYSGQEMLQTFELADKAGTHQLQLERDAREAESIRLVVRSVYGVADWVSIAELSLE
jgi:hypothetical protein